MQHMPYCESRKANTLNHPIPLGKGPREGSVWLKRLVFACMIAWLTPAFAETTLQSHESILAAIQVFIESNFRHPEDHYEVEIAPLDQRLQLAQCSEPIEVFFPPGSQETGNTSVGVRCKGAQPWTLYHRASIKQFKQVSVIKNPIAQGAIIAPGDIMLEKRDIAQLHGSYLTPEQAINKQTRRSLSIGTVLTPDMVAAPKLVKRGQKVDIRARSESFAISMSGIALMDGELGQRIRVRNEQSERIIEGIVTDVGVIEISR